MKKTRICALIAALALVLALIAACGNGTGGSESAANGIDTSREITVVSREEGSGTRGAFVELTGIEVTDDAGTRDETTVEAIVISGTSAVRTTVAGNPYAIGYISLGALDDSVRALAINGAAATAENIISGAYPIQRAFIVCWVDNTLSDLARDFLNFMLSADGQAVVSGSYVMADLNAPAYNGGGLSGRIVVNGSTSVAPVMERLAEAYRAINPDVQIEVHATGSSAGVNAAIDGIADIGMVSRDLRPAEQEVLAETVVAFDGIAVIVNNDNPISGLTVEQVRGIFTGEMTRWSEAQ